MDLCSLCDCSFIEEYKKSVEFIETQLISIGSPGRARTYNPSVNSRMLCH